MKKIQQKNKKTHLLQSNWKKIIPHIQHAGENGAVSDYKLVDDYQFWVSIGVFEKGDSGKLSSTGKILFETFCIRCDNNEKEILQSLLLNFPPTIAIQQYLWGVENIMVSQVLSVLKTTGFWSGQSTEPPTHFLEFLNYVGVIKYDRKNRKVKIILSPDTPSVPKSIFVDPTRPFSNIVWIKKILNECEGFIYWIDKHFQKEALEWLWAIADANKIKKIKILSLDMGDQNLSRSSKRYYKRFKEELANKGIEVTWATIDSTLIRDTHDRWIIGENKYLRNVPNVNAISSGQKSEMNYSENYDDAIATFDEYWNKSEEINI